MGIEPVKVRVWVGPSQCPNDQAKWRFNIEEVSVCHPRPGDVTGYGRTKKEAQARADAVCELFGYTVVPC